jgi:NitT/TauT family transport system substrate-binding protein
MKKYLKTLLFIFLLIALLTSACGQSDQGKKESSPIIIGYSQWPGFAAVNIADQKGFFDAEGVKVQVVVYELYEDSLNSLVEGKVDAYAGTLGDIITTTANQTPLTMVWAFDTPTTAEALVGQSSLSGVADLRGKRVGFLADGYGHLFVDELLKQQGLTEADIIPVQVGPESVPAALAAGEIDAGHAWEPYVSQSVARGAKVLATAQAAPGLILDGLAFRADVVKNRPDDVQAVVRALSKAVDYWQQNPAEGNVICADANGVAETDIASALAGMQIFTLAENQTAFDRSGNSSLSLYNTGQLYIDFFRTQGSLQTTPNLDSILNSSFVQG